MDSMSLEGEGTKIQLTEIKFGMFASCEKENSMSRDVQIAREVGGALEL